MRVAVYHPEIPHNVGALLRVSACWQVPMDFIGPFPFVWSDKHLRRAGMDYISTALYQIYTSWQQYTQVARQGRRILLVPHQPLLYTQCRFASEDTLMVGSESCGFPPEILQTADLLISIPMASQARSLNMSLSATIVLAEALRQLGAFPDPV